MSTLKSDATTAATTTTTTATTTTTTNRKDISELAKLLRKNGDKVLNGSSKLSLSTRLLNNLNDAFSLIIDNHNDQDDSKDDFECSFQVCNNSEIDIFRDLKFLHDFIQKTKWLKVSFHHDHDSLRKTITTIDITKFRHLRHLELEKISIDLVNGIQSIRGQLESISCTGGRGVGKISFLLTNCGGDMSSVGFVWASLKHLALPYNSLGDDGLDKSLDLAPWLQTIDFSHNLISTANEIDSLSSLKHINFSFNKLETIPKFNKITYQTLRILVLKNNYIENLNGLQGLECLAELDLSYNCLMYHSVLWPLETMTALLWIKLDGNPLSYHNNHRILTIEHLHPLLAESKFILDNLPLSKNEKMFMLKTTMTTGTMMMRMMDKNSQRFNIKSDDLSFASCATIASTTTTATATINTTINSNTLLNDETFCSSHDDNDDDDDDNNANEDDNDDDNDNSDANNLMKHKKKKKKKKNFKEAIITDNHDDDDGNEKNSNILSRLTTKMIYSNNTGMEEDHLEIKRKIVALRERFGSNNWLSSNAGGNLIQDMMGIERISDSIIIPTAEISNQENRNDDDDDNEKLKEIVATTTAVATIEDSDEVSEINNSHDDHDDNVSFYDPQEETGSLFLVEKKITNNCDYTENDDESYNNHHNYNEFEQIFLIITSQDIKERNTLTGKIINRWSTDAVLDCIIGRSNISTTSTATTTVNFTFDTTKKDRQYQSYYVESDEDASKIIKTIDNLIKTRPIELKIFKCMKCSTLFSQDMTLSTNISRTPTAPVCPSCNSTLVIQTDDHDELLTDEIQDSKKIPCNNDNVERQQQQQQSQAPGNCIIDLDHSGSHSSIGDETGNGTISMTTSMVYSDLQLQAKVCCSATSLEGESRESTPSNTTATISTGSTTTTSTVTISNTFIKKYDSDIEILSNPSQSSIEVLDEGSKSTSNSSSSSSSSGSSSSNNNNNSSTNRKRASEERKIAMTPTLLTIPDIPVTTAGLGMGLTESSSSGSLTDSICTAYENKNLQNNTPPATVSNLTWMLGGLLESMKIGGGKGKVGEEEKGANQMPSIKCQNDDDHDDDDIQYSYTDFRVLDHRIKLFLILNVFEHDNEEVVLLLRTEILMEHESTTFPGLFILSTFKVYILRIIGPEKEEIKGRGEVQDPQKWLRKESSWTIDKLVRFSSLAFKQGVLIELKQSEHQQHNKNSEKTLKLLCILQDFQRTWNLLYYLNELSCSSVASWQVDFSTSDYHTSLIHDFILTSKYQKKNFSNEIIRIFALFSSANVIINSGDDDDRSNDSSKIKINVGGLIITTCALILTNDKIHWLLLLPSASPPLETDKEIPNKLTEQSMSNLIEIISYGKSLDLKFLDEVIGIEESWTLQFVSEGAAQAVINAIQSPWEELFSIPLQISVGKKN